MLEPHVGGACPGDVFCRIIRKHFRFVVNETLTLNYLNKSGCLRFCSKLEVFLYNCLKSLMALYEDSFHGLTMICLKCKGAFSTHTFTGHFYERLRRRCRFRWTFTCCHCSFKLVAVSFFFHYLRAALWAYMLPPSGLEELHPRCLCYCRKTRTVTFLEFWRQLNIKRHNFCDIITPNKTSDLFKEEFGVNCGVFLFLLSIVHWRVRPRTMRLAWYLPVWTWLGRTRLLQWWVHMRKLSPKVKLI